MTFSKPASHAMIPRIFLLLTFVFFGHWASTAQGSFPDISGTWYYNGDTNYPCVISQNDKYLNFSINNGAQTSNGYFTSTTTVYANDWDAYGELSSDLKKLQWNDQYWTRGSSSTKLPQIQGNYTTADNATCKVTQNGNQLKFELGQNHSDGYFVSPTQVYATQWNAYGNVSADGRSIAWNNQTWTRSSSSGTQTNASPSNYCRKELSTLYWMGQTIGSAWGRAGTTPNTITGGAATDIQSALNYVGDVLSVLTCIGYDKNILYNLARQIPGMPSRNAVAEIEKVIKELQDVISRTDFKCDGNRHPINLYVAGVHMGAAQAWASSRLCQPAPMPATTQNVIRAHLNTARDAFQAYAGCMDDFDYTQLNGIPLNSRNSTEPHTLIVGYASQAMWSIALSDCCCACTPVTVGGGPAGHTSSPCDDACKTYCREQGYNAGTYNGNSVCLFGQIEIPSRGCDCR